MFYKIGKLPTLYEHTSPPIRELWFEVLILIHVPKNKISLMREEASAVINDWHYKYRIIDIMREAFRALPSCLTSIRKNSDKRVRVIDIAVSMTK